MNIQKKQLSELNPAKYNPRKDLTPNDPEYQKLKKSIVQFDIVEPIIWNEKTGNIVGGHQRAKILQELGVLETEVVIVNLSEQQEKALNIALNKISGEWDYPKLKDLIVEIDTGEFDIEVTGFDNIELENLLAPFEDIGWNPEKTEDAEIGDGINEMTGYSLSSFWKDIRNNNSECFKYQIDLPLQKVKKNIVRQKYSRTNLEEIQRIILTYMRSGDYFLENCCGWSTFGSSAKYIGFSGVGVDIWDTAIKHSKKQIDVIPSVDSATVEIKKMDGMNLEFKNGSFDFLYCNPPFMDQEKYSGLDNDIADKDFDSFGSKFLKLMRENYRVLKNNCLCVITINDKREKGVLIPIQKYVIEWGLKAGFALHDFVVAEVQSQKIRLRKKDYEKRRTVKCHEYIIVFIKPE